MEEPVGQDLYADVLERFVSNQAQKMMPLQDLMKQDAIEQPAKCDAQESRSPQGTRSETSPTGIHFLAHVRLLDYSLETIEPAGHAVRFASGQRRGACVRSQRVRNSAAAAAFLWFAQSTRFNARRFEPSATG